MSRVRVFLSLFLIVLLVSGCTRDVVEEGEPDRLGSSWSVINQSLERGDDWRHIVRNSAFQLGEMQVGENRADYLGYGTYPHLDGSTVAVPMALEFARQHLGLSDQGIQGLASFSTTHKAYELLITKESSGYVEGIRSEEGDYIYLDEEQPVDLIIVTEPSAEELELAKQNNVTLVQKPVCYDAFVFITHKDNPVTSLTLEQVRDIYSGKVTNWREVGGDDTPITAYQREANSGSQTAMINMVMKDTPMLPPGKVKVLYDMGGMIESVAEYQNNSASIGYTYRYYIDNLYKNEDIKMININDIPPDDSNIRSGLYPLTTNYYAVTIAGDDNSIGNKFLTWMLSPEGQQCIRQAGYIEM